MKRDNRDDGGARALAASGKWHENRLEKCLREGSAALERSATTLKKIEFLLDGPDAAAPATEDGTS